MKKRILFIGFILIILGLRIDAQTLKNIHRHNLPVLRIPTHLIDKVETSEVNGERVLKVIQLNGYVSQIPVSQIDSITHSLGEALDPAQLGNLRTASVMGVVSGPTGAPEMNAIVRSPYGGEETRTDPNGVFFLNNILVYDKLGYITITKPGFHQGSRSFLPLENGSNRVNVQLLSMTLSGSFSSTTGGTVTSGFLQLSFPANAIQLNGQPYSGIVNVFAEALDPTSTAMFDQMPGELLGGMNDSLRLLRSFGMASIELRDENMNELQLADSVFSTLTFTIPASLQAEAPATIDWWSFDESLGIWMHEGVAQKQGNNYVGQAHHFSWWNCDEPQNFNDYQGSINTTDGTPISDALVNVVSPTMGTGVTYSNSDGVFTGRVPKNQILTLNIYLNCDTTNDWALAYSESIISEEDSILGLYTAELNGHYPITGIVVNCAGQPVESGYVKMGQKIFITNNGSFTIQSCGEGSYLIRGYDLTNTDSIKVSENLTIQVNSPGANAGDIQTCSTIFGSVTDIDGNIYETVLIGSQWWMAENLKTSHFAEGSVIPQITGDIQWTQLTTPAWSNGDSNVELDTIYGNHYNWYSTIDPRGLCPIDWHVPTDEEWTMLTDYLGGIGSLQTIENVGGKMKAQTNWNAPNTNATNESGFSGLGGGSRNEFDGLIYYIDVEGRWWSSTESTSLTAKSRMLYSFYDDVFIQFNDKKKGLSVRCLKD